MKTPNETAEELAGWFAGRLPDEWFTGPPEVTADREEILVVGSLADVELTGRPTAAAKSAARSARVDRFREDTRDQRIRIADEAQHHFRRKVSWGAECGGERVLFTTLSVR